MAQDASSTNLATLIARLQSAGVDWDGENIADLLWLVNYIDAPAAQARTEPDDDDDGDDSGDDELIDSGPLPSVSPNRDPSLTLSAPSSRGDQAQQDKPIQRSIPFQTPTAPALRKTLALGRSLRPLMRKVDSYTQRVLDEDATAEQTAERQFCMTVTKPSRERWLELVLVVEDSASSFLWRDTIRDFQQVLERQGAFRTISTWYLQTASAGAIKLFAKRPTGNVSPRSRAPKELIDISGRRLILVISDCISPAWQTGTVQTEYLSLWANHSPVAIVQMLPGRLWSRTVLSAGLRTSFSGRCPGVPNNQLINHLPLTWEDDGEPGLKLPVITLEPSSMVQWAKMLAGFGDSQAAGIWFDPHWQSQPQEPAPPLSNDTNQAQYLVRRFSKTASDTARELASLMALVPVELSLIYIIQAKLLPQSTPLHVAEVFLSGLIERQQDSAADAEASVPNQGSLFATKRRYEFLPGVRQLLIGTVDMPSAEIVLNEISTYIGKKLGKSIYSFTALLRLEEELGDVGEEFLTFATVTKQALRRLGGRYAELVRDFGQVPVAQGVSSLDEPEPIRFPELEDFDFIDARFEALVTADAEEALPTFPPALQTEEFVILTLEAGDDSEDPNALEPFEVTVVTLTGSGQQWQRQEQPQTAYRYIEQLSLEIPLEMVAIPEGRFVMGSPDDEPERSNRESPQHEVAVESFFMGRYPVTQAQWRVVAAMEQVNRKLEAAPARFKGDNRPVEQVSWHDAMEFCARLSVYAEREYRLPSEAEWEYACRAGTTTPFHFGDMITTEVANYGGSAYANGPRGERRGETTPVNHFGIANDFGLSDMHGNVREWCQDHGHDNYEEAPTDGSAWIEGGNDKRRVLRGGSWYFNPRFCRSAYRDLISPAFRDLIGFRVVCSAPRILP
ncbi:formylglycine-generating enzyme family protein [Leptothoe sp. EHU-05/26/07-4]